MNLGTILMGIFTADDVRSRVGRLFALALVLLLVNSANVLISCGAFLGADCFCADCVDVC